MSAANAKSGRRKPVDLLVLAFEIIAETGWHRFNFNQLAERAELSLTDIRKIYSDKAGLLDSLNERLDQGMLAVDPEDLVGLPPKDRVFELLMSRIEAMTPLRAGLCRLMKDARIDAKLLAMTACRIDRSLTWLQDVADLPGEKSSSLIAQIRRQVQRRILGAVYLQVLMTWSNDDSGDLSKTMAELDKQLRRVERLAGLTTDRQSDNATSAA